MANDRYRYDQDRYRDRYAGDRYSGEQRDWGGRTGSSFDRDRRGSDYGSRNDDGYIARRGFGNERSGYERGYRGGERYGRDRERDFGDSAGYGTGGSTRDWRDVVGEDRGRDWGYPRTGSAYERDRDRHGSGFFGRGSRDYGEDYGSHESHEDRGFFERAGDEIRSWLGDPTAERRREMDMEAGEFRHRGRGPKGYQRSDDRIMEDVNDRLTDDPHLDASEIEVSVSGREVTLNGTVNSRFEKRHAEDLAESVSGVTHVQNNLRVQQYADAGMGGSMLSGAGAAGAGTTGTPDMNPAGTKRRRSSTPSGA